jgi:hypothetical protein
VGPSSKGYGDCSLLCDPQGQPIRKKKKTTSCPSSVTLGNLRGTVVGEAILPLRVDRGKDGFAVDLESSPQGLPDLLCVCNDITKLLDGPLGSQQPPACSWNLAQHMC